MEVGEGREIEFEPSSGGDSVRCPAKQRAQGEAGRKGFAEGWGLRTQEVGSCFWGTCGPSSSEKGPESQGGD